MNNEHVKFHQFSYYWKLAKFDTIANRIFRKLQIKCTIEIFVGIEGKIKLIIQSNCKHLNNEKATISTNKYSAEISCTIPDGVYPLHILHVTCFQWYFCGSCVEHADHLCILRSVCYSINNNKLIFGKLDEIIFDES